MNIINTLMFPHFSPLPFVLLYIAVAVNSVCSSINIDKYTIIKKVCFYASIATIVSLEIGNKIENIWQTIHGTNYAAINPHPDIKYLQQITQNAPPFRIAVVPSFRKGVPHELF